MPSLIMASTQCCNCLSAKRSTSGGSPATRPSEMYKYSDPPNSSVLLPKSMIESPGLWKRGLVRFAVSSMIPTMPMTGVG